MSIIAQEWALLEMAGTMSEHPAEIGFAPAPGNRYLYLFAAAGEVTRRDERASPPLTASVGIGPDTRARGVTAEWLRERVPPSILAQLGLRGTCPACSITVACVGNIDDDDTVDVWSVSSDDRIDASGQRWARGQPIRHINDRER